MVELLSNMEIHSLTLHQNDSIIIKYNPDEIDICDVEFIYKAVERMYSPHKVLALPSMCSLEIVHHLE